MLTDSISATLTIDLSIPRDQQLVAELYGTGEQEQANLVGQKMQEILALLGNSDEA